MSENPLIIPETGFSANDLDRKQPRVVVPGEGTRPPSDAIVLFDGKDLSAWEGLDGSSAHWKVENGCMEIVRHPDWGEKKRHIRTRKSFGDMQLHIEYCSPKEITGDGQKRGNSGIIIMERYEIQVLDSYENPTYADGATGAVYGQWPPTVNSCLGPGEWNVFDIFWKAPVFRGSRLLKPAYVTVLLNGILVQNHAEVLGAVSAGGRPLYTAHPERVPLLLQDHRDPVRFRNIWVRDLG